MKVMLCDCAGTQQIDGEALSRATGFSCSRVHSALCTGDIAAAAEALESGEEVVFACGQEAPRFAELAEALNAADPDCVDIRDRAGWSDDGARTTPKMAALLAESRIPRPAARTIDIAAGDLCLVIGGQDTALPAAQRLSSVLSVTVLLTDAGDEVPAGFEGIDILSGRLRTLRGSLGRFEVVIDALREAAPEGRGAQRFGPPRDGGRSECDIVLDLGGGTPLFPAHEKRDGYLRADPGRPDAVAGAVFEAAQLTGEFEKPLYVRYDASICAHSRAGKTACTNCLDICPTGAISSAGDAVEIDPNICAGCGACAALCPSGAVSYDDPPVIHQFQRLQTLAETYRAAAGGVAPRLLVHDEATGAEMIRLAARYGRGLPADVIPMAVSALEGFGHAEALAALGVGFACVRILPGPKTERGVIGRETGLAQAIAGNPQAVEVIDVSDPDALSDALFEQAAPAAVARPILPLGGRRDVTRLAARALHPDADTPLPLPDTAPYGAVIVDAQACTLCLSCSSLCPSGALMADEDHPRLRFQEDACLQCGLCAGICPEKAITLEARLDLSDRAFDQRVMKEEEPFECIECGKPFGVKSTIERIVEKLEGKHSMFTHSDNARLIRMCDDCRIRAQYHSDAQPFAMGTPPRVRTTQDYIDGREDGEE